MSLPALDADDFAPFFEQVHAVAPFRWQRRLAAAVARTGRWPAVIELPTGSGKTAVLDVAIFHLALEATRHAERRAPVRVALVVDRRLIVDDAFRRACTIAEVLASAPADSAAGRVAAHLRLLGGEGPPLSAHRLRGGVPREDDWARTPSQPTLLCSTVDQVGSRLLFRGYGISDRSKPIHAGLLGSDCRIFLDEAHLAEPFRQTLRWVEHYRGDGWRRGAASPWGVTVLSATPRGPETDDAGDVFRLEEDDWEDPGLRRRWVASKRAQLVTARRGPRTGAAAAATDAQEGPGDQAEEGGDASRESAICEEVERALALLRERGLAAPAIGVVVNRVARARAVYARLAERPGLQACKRVLLIGPARPVDREDAVDDDLAPIRTGAARGLPGPLVVVATQCLEVGVDIDLDGLVSELAPVDALRQRFGRLNRAGRDIEPFASIVAPAADLAPRYDDPVYGRALKSAWEYLSAEGPTVDMGPAAFDALRQRRPVPEEACSSAADAPVLMPAHLDVLAQTAPRAEADIDVALYLHGPERQPAAVTVVWRADLEPGQQGRDTRHLLSLMPPRAREAIALPVWSLRAWLMSDGRHRNELADVPARGPEAGRDRGSRGPRVFRWAGDDDRSDWIDPDDIRPGDTIVVPSHYGGADAYGWDPARPPASVPQDGIWVADVADRAAEPFAGTRFVVRVGPGLLFDPGGSEPGESAARRRERHRQERERAASRARQLQDRLAGAGADSWQDVLDAIRPIDVPESVRTALERLEQASPRRVEVDLDAYGREDGRPRGAVFVARLGLPGVGATGDAGTTEDDQAGSMAGYVETLSSHTARVEALAAEFARRCGLAEPLAADLRLAGFLHDAGKADPRFQAFLAVGDPLGAAGGDLLAKSRRRAPRGAAVRAGLPVGWRHEALSVRLARLHPRFAEADPAAGRDPELVLWLIGTHHGWGRPFFPHADSLDGTERVLQVLDAPALRLPSGPGPQSLAFDLEGTDWAGLFGRLRARYGVWDLARLEAILRLADHRASEAARRVAAEGRDGG